MSGLCESHNARIHRAERKEVTRMSETNEASVQSVVMRGGAMEIDKLVDTLRVKMENAKSEYLRVLSLYSGGKSHLSRLDYHQGVYDGLERAWREAVFAQHDMNRGQSA
jgi:hypothetical protein